MSRDCPLHALRRARSWLSWDYFLFIYLFGVTWQIVYPPRYPYIDSAAVAFLSRSPAILLSLPRQPYVAINSSNLMLVHLAFACYTSSYITQHKGISPVTRPAN